MTPIITRPRPAPPRNRAGIAAAVVATVAGITLLFLIIPDHCQPGELKRAGWKLTISDGFAERMRAAGETPSLRD